MFNPKDNQTVQTEQASQLEQQELGLTSHSSISSEHAPLIDEQSQSENEQEQSDNEQNENEQGQSDHDQNENEQGQSDHEQNENEQGQSDHNQSENEQGQSDHDQNENEQGQSDHEQDEQAQNPQEQSENKQNEQIQNEDEKDVQKQDEKVCGDTPVEQLVSEIDAITQNTQVDADQLFANLHKAPVEQQEVQSANKAAAATTITGSSAAMFDLWYRFHKGEKLRETDYKKAADVINKNPEENFGFIIHIQNLVKYFNQHALKRASAFANELDLLYQEQLRLKIETSERVRQRRLVEETCKSRSVSVKMSVQQFTNYEQNSQSK